MDYTIILPYPTTTGNSHYNHGATRYTKKGGGVGFKATITLNDETKAYRAQVHGHCYAQKCSGLKLAGPLEIEYHLSPPDDRVARDSDNLLKVLKDALTKSGFWADDSNVVIKREIIEWKAPLPGGRVVVFARPFVDLEPDLEP